MPGRGSAEGEFGEKSKATSLYTQYLELSPKRKRAALLLAALGIGAAVRKLGRLPCHPADEGGPLRAALQGEAPNRHELLRSRAGGGERPWKRRPRCVR